MNFAKSIGPDYWEKRKNVFDFKQDAASFLNQGRMTTYVGDQTVTFKGPAVRVAATDPAAQGRSARCGAKSVGRAAGDPRRGRPHATARGGSSTSAAGFDAAYYLYAYPYQRLVLRTRSSGRRGAAAGRSSRPRCACTPTVMRQTKDGRAADRPPLQRPQHHRLPRPARPTTCRSARRSCRSATSASTFRSRVHASAASTWSPKGGTCGPRGPRRLRA